MCSIHGDNSPVDFDATNKLADNTAQSSLVEAQTHRVTQQQAGRTTDRHRRPPQNVDKHLRGFQAGPLQNLLHQHSNRPQHLPMLNRLQAAISPKVSAAHPAACSLNIHSVLYAVPLTTQTQSCATPHSRFGVCCRVLAAMIGPEMRDY